MKTVLNALTDEITHAQNLHERVDAMLGEVADDYFNEQVNNPNTPKGKENIVLFFDENRVKAHIARDYVIELRDALAGMMSIIKDAGREGERLDPIVRLERLGIAASRNGKGREWVAILEKHGLEHYTDFPLSKYSALEADLLALTEGAAQA